MNTVFSYGNMKLEINNDVNINGSIEIMLVEMCQKGSSSQISQNNGKTYHTRLIRNVVFDT